jgi:hypothetical protein
MAKTGSPVTVSPGDEGGPLTNGALHMGTLDLGDLDVFTVSANVGEAIVVRAAEVVSGTSLAPWLRIYSPSGALLDSSTSAVGAEVAVTAASTGTYLVVLADNSSSYAGAGAYRLTMAKTGSPVTVSPGDEGGPLINGAMHTGTLDLGDLDVFTVSANLGEAIVVRAAEIVAGTALTPWLRIYSPSGTLLGNSTTAVAAEVAVTAASSGTYLVVLADNSSAYASAGAYRLTLAKTGAPVTVSPGDEGGPLPTGQNLATIDLGDLDVWTAYYNVGDGIAITMQEITAGSPLAPWLRVYGPTGTLVGNASNAATALVTVTAPASGVYVVVAGDGSSAYAGTGPYRLTKTAGAAANANLTNLTLSQGGLNPAFASGTLQYTANVVSADNTITVTPTLADPTATVAANGVTVASGTPSQSITLVVGTNPISVVVTAQNGTTRTYTVNVDFAFPPLCTYAVSPPDLSNQPKSGGPAQYVVTVPAGCPVTVTPFQPWVTVNSITPNGGTTTVSLQIAPNPGPTRATAIVTAGRLYLITQLPGP